MRKYIQKLYDYRVFIVCLALIGMLGSIDVMIKESESWQNVIFSVSKWMTIHFLFSLLLVSFFSTGYKFIKFLGYILSVTYILLSLINSISFLFWGFGISCRMISIMLESNIRESGEFFSSMLENLFSLNLLIKLMSFVGITVFLSWLVYNLKSRIFFIIICFLSLFGLISSFVQLRNVTEKKNVNIFIRTALDLKYSVSSIHEYQKLSNCVSDSVPYQSTLKSNSSIDNIVVIIGESASRKHHSLYGYELETTPFLDQMKDSLFVFSDVISPYSTTGETMKNLLTFKNSTTNKDEWYKYPSFISLFSKIGYKTYWYSNQEKSGFCGSIEGVISDRCDESEYIGMLYSGDNLQEKYDEDLLLRLNLAMSDSLSDKKLIVLHLMGSHGEYCRRYPKNRSYFSAENIKDKGRSFLNQTKRNLIAEYDNSIRYTDSIVSEAIKMVGHCESKRCMLIYFSDHGEEMYGCRDFAGHSIGYVDIPFIIWVNDKMKKEEQQKVEKLVSSINKPITTEDFINFLLGITDTQYQMYDSTLDFSSEHYILPNRYADDVIYKYRQCE